MTDAVRSIVAAGGVVLSCACVFGGISLRSRVDLDGANLTASTNDSMLNPWVASQNNSDVSIPVGDYYVQMLGLLRQYYVEPVSNDQKLATGSVRGMISSLGDPNAAFMEPDEFHAFRDRQAGLYQGIGVDLTLESVGPRGADVQPGAEPAPQDAEDAVARMPKIPKLVVSAVVPGGPADRAGVRVGDQVSYIDGHWVVDQVLLDKFRTEQRLFNARKIQYSDIAPLQRELRQRTERALLPMKAGDRLLVGKTGSVTVVWTRGGQQRTTKLNKVVSRMPGFEATGDVIRLPITPDAATRLEERVKNRKAVTIDLRNDPEGDYAAMQQILQELAPTGNYGEFANSRHESFTTLSVGSGNPHSPKITLIVDKSTNGPAAILASALSSHGHATLKGSEMGSDLQSRQTVELSDGSGYTLPTGEYRATVSKPNLVATAEEKRR